jgi:transcriptional regulator with XRE-family HTH domain
MDGRKIVGSQLRDLRLQSDLSTAELAEKANVGEGHIRNIEGKGDQPSGRLAYRLARVLTEQLGREITLDDFSYLTDEQAAA